MYFAFIFYCAITSFTLWAASRGDTSTVPSACYNICNNAYLEAQQIGKVPALCMAESPFLADLTACQGCVAAYGANSSVYLDPEFAQFLDFCTSTITAVATTARFSSSEMLSAELASAQSQFNSLQSVASSLHTTFSNLAQPTVQTSSPSSSTTSSTPGILITTVYATLTPSTTPSSTATGNANSSGTNLSSASSTSTSTSHIWIAGAVVGPVVGIGAILLIILFMRRRRQRQSAGSSAVGVEEKANFDKAQLHADSLQRKDPSEMVGSLVVLPAELPAREDVAVELAGQGREEPIR